MTHKAITLLFLSMVLSVYSFNIEVVDSLTCQRTDGSGLFDIYYNLTGLEDSLAIEVGVTVFTDDDERLPATTFIPGSAIGIVSGNGRKQIAWNFAFDNPGREFYTNNLNIQIVANTEGSDPFNCLLNCFSLGNTGENYLYDAAINPINQDIVAVGYYEIPELEEHNILMCIIHTDSPSAGDSLAVDCYKIRGLDIENAKKVYADTSKIIILGTSFNETLTSYDVLLIVLNPYDYSLIDVFQFGTENNEYGISLDSYITTGSDNIIELCAESWDAEFGNWDIIYTSLQYELHALSVRKALIIGGELADNPSDIQVLSDSATILCSNTRSYETDRIHSQSIMISRIEPDTVISTLIGSNEDDLVHSVSYPFFGGTTYSYSIYNNGLLLEYDFESSPRFTIIGESCNMRINEIGRILDKYYLIGSGNLLCDEPSLDMFYGEFTETTRNIPFIQRTGSNSMDGGYSSVYNNIDNKIFNIGYTAEGSGLIDCLISISNPTFTNCCSDSCRISSYSFTPHSENVSPGIVEFTPIISPYTITIEPVEMILENFCYPEPDSI